MTILNFSQKIFQHKNLLKIPEALLGFVKKVPRVIIKFKETKLIIRIHFPATKTELKD
jgi:hypothetical protein